MKKNLIYLAIGFFATALASAGCNGGCGGNNPYGPNYSNNPTPTPVPGSNTVTAAGTTFSPSSLTIVHGSTVTFDSSFNGAHTVYIGTGATCTQNYSTFPQTVTFSTAGTYYVHCSIHSSCGTSTCTSGGGQCPGMAMTITVN